MKFLFTTLDEFLKFIVKICPFLALLFFAQLFAYFYRKILPNPIEKAKGEITRIIKEEFTRLQTSYQAPKVGRFKVA